MWTSVGPGVEEGTSPSCRSKHSATLLGSHVYLLGGRNGNLPLKDFWRYSLVSGCWEVVAATGERPPCLQEHTAVAYKDSIYVFGGELGFSAGSETPLWIYHVKSGVWRKVRAPRGVAVPGGRRGHTAMVHRGAMLVYGGYQDLRGSSNELWAFHFDTESWHLLSSSKGSRASDLPPARHKHSAVLHDDSIFVYGGMTDLQERSDLWKWDTVSRHWSCVKSKPNPGPLHSHAACNLPSSMLVFGGERDGRPTSELWRFHFGTNTWERINVDGLRPNPCADGVALAVSELLLSEPKLDKESPPEQPNLKARSRGTSADRGSRAHVHGNRISPCEKKYVFTPTSVNYVDGSVIREDSNTKRTQHLSGSQTPGANTSFLKEITKLSQMNLSRLSHHNCSYSVLTTNKDDRASQESLIDAKRDDEDAKKMTKSQSANVISRRRILSAASPDTANPVSILRNNTRNAGRGERIPRDVTSVPNFGLVSTLPTPVLTPIEITRLVFLESDDDVENDVFDASPNIITVESATFSTLHQQFQPPGSKRSDSYNSHLVSHSLAEEAKTMPKSASVRFRKQHSVVEIEDYDDTSDYASNENMNRITSASSYAVAKSPEGDENVRTRKNKKEGPFGFSNPNYLGPDIQSILSGNRKTWHVTSPSDIDKFTSRQQQAFAKVLNSPPDSVLEDVNGRSISRQFYHEEMMELQDFESPVQSPKGSAPPPVVSSASPRVPPHFLALSGTTAPMAVEKKKGRAKSASRETDFSPEQKVPLYVFVVGGKEHGKVTSYQRPVTVWRLQLAANVF